MGLIERKYMQKPLIVELIHFHENGKYHVKESVESKNTIKDPLYQTYEWIQKNMMKGDYVMVNIPEHPDNYPRLLLKDLKGVQ